MNRIQFFILTGISAIVLILMAANIFLSHRAINVQTAAYQTQQNLTTGERFRNVLTSVVQRINAQVQKNDNKNLKSLLARQKIAFQGQGQAPTPAASTNSTETPAAPTK